jgi:N6-L-threonylcarbamoyladenine synthase
MARILGIDTSNYTTSVGVVEDGAVILNGRKMLKVDLGEKGLRQSEALFQHVINLPCLLDCEEAKNPSAVCVSTKPRPLEKSYMPVFRAGESIARSLGSVLGIPVFETTHQEGHIEAACRSADFIEDDFIAFHISGGTSEVLKVSRGDGYNIQIVGGSRDISLGQFIDRIGVAAGLEFPSGRIMDCLALENEGCTARIPSKVEGLYFNLSGQETAGLRYIKDGYNQKDMAFIALQCAAKTLEKLLVNVYKAYDLPVIITGGVASSLFIRHYLEKKFKSSLLTFSKPEFAGDNAAGVAFIGYEKYAKE